MGFNKHATTFAGLPVIDYARDATVVDPERNALRLTTVYEDGSRQWPPPTVATVLELLESLLERPDCDRIAALVIGAWTADAYEDDSASIIEGLIAAAPQLASLRGVFIGDILAEECEVSWIQQSDVSPLWSAYPKLEHFRVRGGEGLRVGIIEHDFLKSLTIECGGLPAHVLHDLARSRLPVLEHLELYLGEDSYGWDGSVADLEPLLSGKAFPKLRYLGLRDSEIADEVAKEVVKAPLLERVEVLDLSLGTLTDDGAAALLECPAIKRLKRLDLHHHFLSDKMMTQLQELGPEVNVSEKQKPHTYGGEDWRYVAVGE